MTESPPRRSWWPVAALAALALAACSESADMPPTELDPHEVVPTDQVVLDYPGGTAFAVGDLHTTVDLPIPGSGVSIAFDGTRLLYNGGGNNLVSFEPGDPAGTVQTVDVGMDLDAMAWDATRGLLWASVHGSDDIYTVDPATGTATFQFSAAGKCVRCIGTYRDGLAFDANDPADPSDDRIWWSRDVDYEIYELDLTGATTRTLAFSSIVASPQNLSSGIAVGGPDLYLANNGYDKIFRVDKATFALVEEFAAPGERPEDLECDPVTYAPVEVMWVRRFENPNNVLAYEIPAGTCGIGGAPPGPPEEPVTDVSIDIKPGSWPNSIAVNTKRGRMAVAVLSDAEFDAAVLDPSTITLGDGEGDDTPVAMKKNGTLFASMEDVDDDGDMDLVVHFSVPELVMNGDLTPETTELYLNGEDGEGNAYAGMDAVRVTPSSR